MAPVKKRSNKKGVKFNKTPVKNQKSKTKQDGKVKSNFKVTKNKTQHVTKGSKGGKLSKATKPPSSPKKRAAKGLYYKTDANGGLAVRKGDSDDEEVYGRRIDYYPDDPDDADYVDDSDADINNSVAGKKYDYGDLDEEGGCYAVLLKNGEWVEEKKHELEDPKHETCVLELKKEHTMMQL